MRVFLLIVLHLILLACKGELKPPTVLNGSIDLREWDFNRDGIVPLDGMWEFYWGEFIDPQIFKKEGSCLSSSSEILECKEFLKVLEKKNNVYIPNNWSSYTLKENPEKSLGAYGFATFRLKIYFESQSVKLLKINPIGTAQNIYINGKLYFTSGKIGKSESESIPHESITNISLDPELNAIDLIIHVSNFHSKTGGIYESIIFGNYNDIIKYREFNLFKEIFSAGILSIMGFYHLGIYFSRKKETSALWFGLFGLTVALRSMLTGENYYQELFPDLPFYVLLKLEYLTIPLTIIFLANFINSIYRDEMNSDISKILIYINIVYITIILLFPTNIFTYILLIIQITVILSTIYGLYVISLARKNHKIGANIFLLGFFILTLCVINDIMYSMQAVQTKLFSQYGFIIFIFSQSYVLSIRISTAFNASEKLTEDLTEISAKLELKVMDRTQDLENEKYLLEKALRKTEKLNQMIQVIINSKSIDEIFENIRELFKKNYGFNSYSVYIVNLEDKKIKLFKNYGYEKLSESEVNECFKIEFEMYNIFCLHSNCIIKNKSFMSYKLKNPHVYENENKAMQIIGMKCIYIIPLIAENKVFGTITISDDKYEPLNLKSLTSEDKMELENFVKLISPSIFQSLQRVVIEKTNKDLNLQREITDNILNKLLRLNSMNEIVVQSISLNDLFQKLLNVFNINYNLNSIYIYLLDNENTKLNYFNSFSLDDSLTENQRLFLKERTISILEMNCIHKAVLEKGRPFIFKNIKSPTLSNIEMEIFNYFKVKNYYSIPLINEGTSFGVLNFSDNYFITSNIAELTKSDRKEIENFIKIITPFIFQSLQKGIIEKAFKDLQETQAQLIEAERMASLGQLVGGVAHEINNPIGVVRSNTELIRKNLNSTVKIFPEFLTKLNDEEKVLFDEMIEEALKNKKFLSTKEERVKKRQITAELETLLSGVEDNSSQLIDQILLLKLESTFPKYIEKLGISKFKEFLQMTQLLLNQSASISNIEIAVEKVSRVVYALRSYMNTETYNQKREVNLVEELEKALQLYDNYIVGKINLTKDFPEEVRYDCIAENLSQAWKNIIFNAIQSMNKTEKNLLISIKVEKEIPDSIITMKSSIQKDSEINDKPPKEYIIVSIKDSGIGIPSHLQEKVFTPFFTTKGLGEGIGLGLYVSKKIIHEHRGRIYYESSNGGTEFHVVLRKDN